MRQTGFPPAVRRMILERAGIEGEWCRDEITGAWAPVSLIQVHHRTPRGSGGAKRLEINQAANGLAVSQETHSRIESHRTDALANGWLISKLTGEVPSSVPVLLHHGWVLLADDGTWEPTEVAA